VIYKIDFIIHLSIINDLWVNYRFCVTDVEILGNCLNWSAFLHNPKNPRCGEWGKRMSFKKIKIIIAFVSQHISTIEIDGDLSNT
jgi:hypothetical protein